jgi:hypothetical protein
MWDPAITEAAGDGGLHFVRAIIPKKLSLPGLTRQSMGRRDKRQSVWITGSRSVEPLAFGSRDAAARR